MQITLDLDTLATDSESFAEAVERRAADRLLQGLGSETRHAMAVRITKARDEEIKRLVREQVAQAMAAPIQRTTKWGESTSEPVTIRELVREELERFLNLAESRGRSRDHNHNPTCLAHVVEDAARTAMNNELKKEIHDARKLVGTAIRDKALAAAVAAIAPSD